jgi:hypothetical protein
VSLLCDNLRVARSGRANKVSGNDPSELCDRSMYVKAERSQMDSGKDVRRLFLSLLGELISDTAPDKTAYRSYIQRL